MRRLGRGLPQSPIVISGATVAGLSTFIGQAIETDLAIELFPSSNTHAQIGRALDTHSAQETVGSGPGGEEPPVEETPVFSSVQELGFEGALGQPPLDIGAVLRYNGFVFNDRRRPDRSQINDIDGLEDADIRDSREDIPGADGETPYDAFYKGRTVAINGHHKAGNLQMLQKRKRDMGGAFADLIERDLIFERYDVVEDFKTAFSNYWEVSSPTPAPYAIDSNSGILAVESLANSYTEFFNETEDVIDSDVYVRGTIGATAYTNTNFISIVLKRKNSGNYVIAEFFPSVPKLQLYIKTNDVLSTARIDYSPAIAAWASGDQFWFKASLIGDTVTLSVYRTDPELPTTTAAATSTYVLTGSEITNFGTGVAVKGYAFGCGNTSAIVSIPVNFTLFRRDAYNPCDVSIKCRKQSGIAGKEVQDGQQFKRSFLLSLRASDPRFYSRHELTKSVVIATSLSSGRTYDLGYDDYYDVSLNTSNQPTSNGSSILTFDNKGNYKSLPRFRIYGQVTNVVINNITNGKIIKLNGTINDGEYVEIDCSKRTIVDSNGVSRYSLIDQSSDWLHLEKGINTLNVSADVVGGAQSNAKTCFLYGRSAWL